MADQDSTARRPASKRVRPDLIQPRRITSNTPDSYGTDVTSQRGESSGDKPAPKPGGGR